MRLPENQINSIAENPLSLEYARAELLQGRNACSVLMLLFHLAAKSHDLCSSTGEPIDQWLFEVVSAVKRGNLYGIIERLDPLIQPVVDGLPDVDVWAAALALREDIPHPLNSSQLYDSSEVDAIENELFYEIKNCTFRNVTGFWDKYFNPEHWRQQQKHMYTRMFEDKNSWRFPEETDESSVWKWLLWLEARYLTGAPNKLCNTKAAHKLLANGEVDVYFRLGSPGRKHDDTSTFKSTILQLARLVRRSFREQPTRRFVHGFLLCSSTMELWIFDRSGLYSSGEFNIVENPDLFARASIGYATMDNNALGRDVFIKQAQEIGKYRQVILYDANSSTDETTTTTIGLAEPLISQNAIVSRGTTCFKTDNNQVAKFAWAPAKWKLELNQLQNARAKGVKGVAQLVAYRRITTISKLREGLIFPDPHHYLDPYYDLSSSSGSALSNKRKFGESDGASDHKKRRSNNGRPVLTQPSASYQPDLETINENNQATPLPTSVESPGDDQTASLLSSEGPPAVASLPTSIESLSGNQAASFSTESMSETTNKKWENRIYSCIVISPAGRVISKFDSIKELLEAMRDAIRAHHSLYTVGGLLHCDISPNNIIITDPKTADGFKGMLIDLDLAKQYTVRSEEQTGTKQFMAVGVLRKYPHNYRHDLESFFYVLLWMCAGTSWRKPQLRGKYEEPTSESQLRRWSEGDLRNVANSKVHSMIPDGFYQIMEEFPKSLEVVKPLCIRIRRLLFPAVKDDQDARFDFHFTPEDPNKLYDPIIAAYDKAIHEIASDSPTFSSDD
ncbi:serine/threonine-protein kinase Sgk2 [Xylaria cubensis]|nr:serine/threonine-protein kinase Sgk2 [Xylaria cubensis]